VDQEQRKRLHGLLVRLADGDRQAFDPMFEMLWPVVARFAHRALGGSADAEDAAQNALEKILAQVSQFDRQRDGLSWVLSVTAWECRTARQKKRRRREEAASTAEPIDAVPSPEEAAITRDIEASLHEAVGSLSPLDAETLRAVLVEAPVTMKASTFRKRLQRALGRLRTAWSDRHDLDE
jgi:RNA polymerase sigma factor (sigma-70 family)